jgi:hypothetical protein
MVAVDQLGEIRSLLDANNVGDWVDEQAISLDGKPEISDADDDNAGLDSRT